MSRAIYLATTDECIAACYPVISQLRPHIARDHFVQRIRRQMDGGYELACLEDGGGPAAVAGFRSLENLAWGRIIYVDDLVTDAGRRSSGCGAELLHWLLEEGRRRGCDALHLDSGVQRFDAHRFYLRERMRISSHHFDIRLNPAPL